MLPPPRYTDWTFLLFSHSLPFFFFVFRHLSIALRLALRLAPRGPFIISSLLSPLTVIALLACGLVYLFLTFSFSVFVLALLAFTHHLEWQGLGLHTYPLIPPPFFQHPWSCDIRLLFSIVGFGWLHHILADFWDNPQNDMIP